MNTNHIKVLVIRVLSESMDEVIQIVNSDLKIDGRY